MSLVIRQLDGAALADYTAIRLEALQRAPDAFASDYDDEAAAGDAFHALRLNSGAVYGAYHDGRIAGMIGVICFPERKIRHRAAIWGVYVSPDCRRKGAGRLLMEAALNGMPAHIKRVTLGVATHNEAAMSLYRSMGFEQYGVEKMALIDRGQSYDEYLMVKFL